MKTSIVNFAFLYYVTLGLMACGGSFESQNSKWASLNSVQGGVLEPKTDQMASDCMTNESFDTCVFKKSPSAQEKKLYLTKDLAEVATQRLFGVKLSSLDGSGKLRNANLRISTIRGSDLLVTDPLQLKSATPSMGTYTEQLMAYYWLNRTFEFYKEQTGGLPLESKSISVVVDDKVSGFRPATNSIHLSIHETKLPMALDASVMVHFLGQANVYWASDGHIYDYREDSAHKVCEGDPQGCCKTELGCSKALLYGSADYLVATMFPKAPQLAETWGQNLKGQEFCGLNRSVEAALNLSAKEAYSRCGTTLKGKAHMMGVVYASIWWEVRKQVEKLAPGEVPNIDKLHMEHLKKLKGSMTLASALAPILEADQKLFKGRYGDFFKLEFKRRGL